MLSESNRRIVDLDTMLPGLEIVLDAEACELAISQHAGPVTFPLQTKYVRYKPGRRCINMMVPETGDIEQCYVLTAYSEAAFDRRSKKSTTRHTTCHSWEIPDRKMRIDQFPHDPILRYIERCFETNSRSRLMRRIFGPGSTDQPAMVRTLAYKPGRRYTARLCRGQGDRESESTFSNVLKIYSAHSYTDTKARLQIGQQLDITTPTVVALNDHYRSIALQWVEGDLLAELIEIGLSNDSLLYEVGCQLARLHRCEIPHSAVPAATAHQLEELSHFIAFLYPELEKLAIQTVNATRSRLSSMEGRSTMIHGDFYSKQVIVDQRHVRFIDFDQSGIGNPYQDIGNFVAKLYWQALQHGDLQSSCDSLKKHERSFLEGYRSISDEFSEGEYAAHLASGLIRCATHPFRRDCADWHQLTRELLETALSILQPSRASELIQAACW